MVGLDHYGSRRLGLTKIIERETTSRRIEQKGSVKTGPFFYWEIRTTVLALSSLK
jgi:hypothetical protein